MFHELEATLFPSFHVQTLFDHSLGKVLDISCVYPPTFFWPSTVFPGEDGKKDGPQVGHSTKKPDSPGTKFIIQMRNQSANTTASIYSASGCILGSHGPPQTQQEGWGVGKQERP